MATIVKLSRTLLGLYILLLHLAALCSCCSFTVSNNCPHTIWPATLAGAGTPQLPTTGFRLDCGEGVSIPATPGWSGRIWARTGCSFDEGGAGSCQTGDCGGRLECGGMAGLPPTTLFEITMGKGTDRDFYDVSLVDGYNLPVYAAPRVVAAAAYGYCNATGCVSDLINSGCPRELQVDAGGGGGDGRRPGEVVACKSACEAFGLDSYCCRGEYANPTTCRPSIYSAIFQAACPRAYSYAFDDATSTFTCKATEYSIVFCPASDSYRRSSGRSPGQPVHAPGQPSGEAGAMAASSSDRLLPSGILPLLLPSILVLWTHASSLEKDLHIAPERRRLQLHLREDERADRDVCCRETEMPGKVAS